MGFNYALEKKKFEQEWDGLRAFYRESGMAEADIQAMYDYDWAVFKADRIEALHTQELTLPPDTDDDSDAPESPLMDKFQEQLTCEYDAFGGHDRYWWLEELDDPRLVAGAKKLSPEDKELLTLHILDGLTTREIAARLHTNPMKVSRQLQRVFAIFKSP